MGIWVFGYSSNYLHIIKTQAHLSRLNCDRWDVYATRKLRPLSGCLMSALSTDATSEKGYTQNCKLYWKPPNHVKNLQFTSLCPRCTAPCPSRIFVAIIVNQIYLLGVVLTICLCRFNHDFGTSCRLCRTTWLLCSLLVRSYHAVDMRAFSRVMFLRIDSVVAL